MPIVDLNAFLERANSKNDPFDYLIIGGGTAGLIIAHRLAQNLSHVTVGVIEAGTYHGSGSVPVIDTPGLFGRSLNNPLYDWALKTEPQVNANNRTLVLPRGKGLGGSSLINYLGYTRPSKGEYDALETTFNNHGWNWDELIKHMKSEHFQEKGNEWLGSDSSHVHEPHEQIKLTLPPVWPPTSSEAGEETLSLHELTFQTMDNIGIPPNPNPTNGNNIGYARPLICADPKSGIRSSSVSGYLEPILKSCTNLLVLIDASVTRVLFDRSDSIRKPRAVGVEFRVSGHDNNFQIQNVRREVILSAGSLKTPDILEHSGIGDPRILQQNGINCIAELPGVGSNFQDHPAVPMIFEVDPKYPTLELLLDPEEFEKHQKLFTEKQEGILAGGLSFSLTFLPLHHISDITKTPSNIILDKIQTETEKYVETSNFSEELRQGYEKQCQLQMKWLKDPRQAQIEIVCAAGFVGPNKVSQTGSKKRHLTLTATLMHPFSRGTVHHHTAIPDSNETFPPNNAFEPKINPRLISHPTDYTLLMKGVECILRLTQTEPLKSAIRGYASPSELSTIDLDKLFKSIEEGQEDHESKSRLEEILNSHIKNVVRTVHHPIGTAAMMSKEDGGVVDEQLRVYGVDGLRVADLSILPFEVSTHTVSTAFAIGEMASDILIKAYGNH
ncbi:hypothetical protein AGABI2DRAFT_121236 [Agaricus bisporus var. bisporus H97]|uniref:hypothetical protein n=1 Tax=Agaricus bisporus var. bisporus (strain H97 / ATCC MYA-4626 / FGSC 10389) TaxID=936046 RepID=UPI00029F6D5A|nr:hypothetical protein AGABI2DRAFT_121236 [Agaricus bisporus var. bisporus H97]EKV44042.1 hypothetical protein AGABI2DRAFT_121236 [Agaricus bisporus var. bisporus H97]